MTKWRLWEAKCPEHGHRAGPQWTGTRMQGPALQALCPAHCYLAAHSNKQKSRDARKQRRLSTRSCWPTRSPLTGRGGAGTEMHVWLLPSPPSPPQPGPQHSTLALLSSVPPRLPSPSSAATCSEGEASSGQNELLSHSFQLWVLCKYLSHRMSKYCTQ